MEIILNKTASLPQSCIVSYKTLVKSINISRQMYRPYNSKNSKAQLMTLGFGNSRRQLKCTQSYIKKSFHEIILKRSQRLRKYWYQSTNNCNVKIDKKKKTAYTRASFKVKNKEHNTWVRISFPGLLMNFSHYTDKVGYVDV